MSEIQGWNSTHPIFKALIESVRPKTIIEVGSWKGASAVHMAQLAPEATIYCVDTWLGSFEHYRDSWIPFGTRTLPDLFPQFLQNTEPFKDRIIPIPLPSNLAAKVLARRKITADMIYIDGSHESEDVRADLKNYLPLLNEGGVIFGDDYDWESVKVEVDKYGHQIHDGKFWSMRK